MSTRDDSAGEYSFLNRFDFDPEPYSQQLKFTRQSLTSTPIPKRGKYHLPLSKTASTALKRVRGEIVASDSEDEDLPQKRSKTMPQKRENGREMPK